MIVSFSPFGLKYTFDSKWAWWPADTGATEICPLAILLATQELATLSPIQTFQSMFLCGEICEAKFSTVAPNFIDSNAAITESSVGVEDITDLIYDLETSFKSMK